VTARPRGKASERARGECWDLAGSVLPVEARIDSVGRIVLPKPLRDALGLRPGSTVDISRYGGGLAVIPAGRTARLVDEDGVLVATGDTVIDDATVFGLLDAGRR
jgi:AbrB family looped-hinge helix DNA binding protein